ncbi:ultraviolet-B receptor UVR8 [Acrasis kona]|uniref:Ultraviolet-B receptor UVR8 n=1 Tax=Acrasis kona TaxID=1008807 RepID=A0AAW2ZKP2_9EUKA
MQNKKRKIDSVSGPPVPLINKRSKSTSRFKYYEDVTFIFTTKQTSTNTKNVVDLLRRKIWEGNKQPRLAFGWGCNANGQLGVGNRDVHDKPEQLKIPDHSRLSKIASGNTFTVFLTCDGRLYSCGWGPGSSKFSYFKKLSIVNGLPYIRSVVAGRTHIVALSEAGDVYFWRKGIDDIPVRLSDVPNTLYVSCGQNTSFTINESGHVHVWGNNSSGQLGLGDLVERVTPIRNNYLHDIIKIEGGDAHTIALSRNGTLYSFGSNTNGQLGVYDYRGSQSPTPILVDKIPNGIRITDINCGDYSCVVLTSDGNVYSWGKNADGQLSGRPSDDQNTPKIVRMPEKKRVLSISSGYKHTLAMMEDGSVWSWGQSRIGQLGRDEGNKSWEITELKDRGVMAVFADAYLSFALCK